MSGKVFTFYSYKGGVGRSMAMANIGALLARWGKKILVIDWDLEAPGLENYFKQGNETRITELNKKEGLIDLLLKRKNDSNYTDAEIKWTDFISTVPVLISNNSSKQITVDILTAGRKDESYIKRVREMDYGSFYDDHRGGDFLEGIREYWISKYDFVLIDSRTGLTDSSGVCSIQMPDVLVMLFTATDLGFKGTLEIAQRAIKAQKSIIYDRYALKVLPIPTRFDSTEFKLQQEWLGKFELGLKPIYATWVPDYPNDDNTNIDQRKILELTKLPYIPYFSYGESLPVIEQGTDDPQGLGYAFETVAAILSHDLEGAKLLADNRSEYVRRAIKSISPYQKEQETIKIALPVTPRSIPSKYMITGLVIVVILVLLSILFGKNKLTNLKKESIQVDSLKKELNIATIKSIFGAMDTNNISDVLELNKQIYASGLHRDTAKSIELIQQTIKNRVQSELEFTLPLVYQEIRTYNPKAAIDLSSKKDSYETPLGPIEKYFADTILQFGSFKLISNERLQDKLNKVNLDGFKNSIDKDSITVVAFDSSGFEVRYLELGNYFFKDTFYVKDSNVYSLPVTLTLDKDLKINNLKYGLMKKVFPDKSSIATGKKPIKMPVRDYPIKSNPKIQLIRVEIYTIGEKPSSRQILQSNAIFEELNLAKIYQPRKSYLPESSNRGSVGMKNRIQFHPKDKSKAIELQMLLSDQLFLNFELYEDPTSNLHYFSLYISDQTPLRSVKKR